MSMTVSQLAAISRASLERAMTYELELTVAVPHDEEIIHGVFDRGPLRRGSGGAAVRVGPGSVWIQLLVAHPKVDPSRLMNRHVRPLLAALAKVGPPGRYFGRDWVSVEHAPAAFIGFSFDERSGRALVEMIVAAETRFDIGPRDSFRGQEPRVLAIDTSRAAAAARAAYEASGAVHVEPAVPPTDATDDDFAWTVTADEPIGRIGAAFDARGRLRFGGELMTSRQAIEALEVGVAPEEVFLFGVSPRAIANLLASLPRA